MFASLSSTSRMIAMSVSRYAGSHGSPDFVSESLAVEASLAHNRRHVAVEPRSVVWTYRRRRDDHDGDARRRGQLSERLNDLEAVHLRHHEVQNDEIGQLLAGHIDGFASAVRPQNLTG